MSYLYGDSTPSSLEVNYIEFLRDAVDFCVHVLLADQRIAEGKATMQALERSTSAEIANVERAGALVPKAFDGAVLGEPQSPATRCAAAIMQSAAELARAAVVEVRATFEAEASRRDTAAVHERETCLKALERLLVRHDLPDMKTDLQIALGSGGRYVCRARVSTGFGVEAALDLDVPLDHLFERVVRVDRLVERLDVQAPEMGGWLHKEIKLRPQHLDKHHVAAFSVAAAGDTLKLRSAPDGSGAGFDIVFGAADGSVRLFRVGEGETREDPPFDVEKADLPKLFTLRERLVAAGTALTRHRKALTEAKLDGEPLRGHAQPSLVAERLIIAMTPVVQEIASRSQSPGELVLRRLIGDDRREEIFLSKQELKVKLEPLGDRSRAMFDPLWLTPPISALPPRPRVPTPFAAPPPPPPRIDPIPAVGFIEVVELLSDADLEHGRRDHPRREAPVLTCSRQKASVSRAGGGARGR